MIEEIWKSIPEYEGLYEISNKGQVRSLDRVIKHRHPNGVIDRRFVGKILKPSIAQTGYFFVAFSKNGINKTHNIHRLVAISFIENTEHKREVNHIDRNKLNNNVDNLEWCSPRENSTHHCLSKNKTSKYTGVHRRKRDNKWVAAISVSSESKTLSIHKCETAAMIAYQKALHKINGKTVVTQ